MVLATSTTPSPKSKILYPNKAAINTKKKPFIPSLISLSMLLTSSDFRKNHNQNYINPGGGKRSRIRSYRLVMMATGARTRVATVCL